MLNKIISIKNVALFHQVQSVAPLSIDFRKTTLVYGDNASGKSSLSEILRSASTRNATPITRRKTNDQAGPQEVKLLFDSLAEFDGVVWTGARPKIEVFDSTFVAENVYAGHAITTEHRRNLFVFALGDSVADQQKLDQLSKDASDVARKVGEKRRALEPLAKPYIVDKFEGITPDPNIDKKLSENQRDIDAAKNSVAIMARKMPEKLPELVFDESAFFSALKVTLPKIEAEADRVMKEQLTKHESAGYAAWLLQGKGHQVGDECPYCSQSVSKVDLIGIYKNYFNSSYDDHKAKIEVHKREVSILGEKIVVRWEGILNANTSTVDAWQPEYPCKLPTFDHVVADKTLERIREGLTRLVDKKVAAPLELLEDQSLQDTLVIDLNKLREAVASYNKAIDLCNDGIAGAKKKVTAANLNFLETQKLKLEAEKRRFDPDVANAVQGLIDTEKESQKLDTEKKELKTKIDAQMAKALSEYMDKINEYLVRFSAKFLIVDLSPNYLGSGKPRTEFALEIRGKEVRQLEKDALRPAFDTVLSEGDKRTLAFAFFMAQLSRNALLKNYTIVFDDPVTSLDVHRRRETVKVLGELANDSRQLIVLSHDPYFLQHVEEKIAGAALWKICQAPQDYSGFEVLNLKEMCRSSYEQNYYLLNSYIQGLKGNSDREIAAALRPSVEGYFNRRYPGSFGATKTLGAMIEFIAENPTDPRFLSMSPSTIKKLRDFNEYARRFHHDSGVDFRSDSPNPTELKKYAAIALGFIHTDGLKP